jgi:hypothetical protein
MRLQRLGSYFGHGPRDGETATDYALRVFDLDDVAEHDSLATAFHPARLT